MTRPTVVFDTNVLVAELAFPDESPACVALSESGAVEAAVSPAVLREFAAVLDYDHLPLDRERHSAAVERVADFARVVDPGVSSGISFDAAADPDDDAVLECAVSAAAHGVVSDDYHLRDLDGAAGVEVVTRAAFLDRFADRRVAAVVHRNAE